MFALPTGAVYDKAMEKFGTGLLFDENAQEIIPASYSGDKDPYDSSQSSKEFTLDEEVLFTSETLMPMPEKTYCQELLDQPIPLSSRIEHLVTYVDVDTFTDGALNTEYYIANSIGSTARWVRKQALEIGIEATSVGIDPDGREQTIYPSPSLELLREEWRWHNEVKDLGAEVLVGDFERLLGKTEKWAIKYALELGFEMRYLPSQSSSRTRVLPYAALDQLRHLILMFPPQGGWLTADEVGEFSGRESPWLATHLGRVGITAERRWSSLTGRLIYFYPPNSKEALDRIKEELPQPAGDWLSALGIVRKIGMTEEWTFRRLHELNDTTAETRLNDINVPRLHYSPVTVAIIEQMANEAKAVPEIEDWYNISALSRAIGRGDAWVRRRLPYITSMPELRRDSTYCARMCYPPEALNELLKIQDIKLSDLRADSL